MKKNKKQMLALRILLGILIVCNMAVIFLLSSQSSTQSSALSQKITVAIARILPKEYFSESASGNKENSDKNTISNQKPNLDNSTGTPSDSNKENEEALTKEQEAFVRKSHTHIRKLAHMIEFGALATLAFLFLVTWRGNLLWRYAASLGFAFLYAATDEFHQQFSKGRGALFSDVIIDFYGALIACTVALIVVIVVRRIQTPKNERLSIAEELSLCFTQVSKTFSRCREFVSKQISKLSKIHHKKEREK